jgi:hypothetical protein
LVQFAYGSEIMRGSTMYPLLKEKRDVFIEERMDAEYEGEFSENWMHDVAEMSTVAGRTMVIEAHEKYAQFFATQWLATLHKYGRRAGRTGGSTDETLGGPDKDPSWQQRAVNVFGTTDTEQRNLPRARELHPELIGGAMRVAIRHPPYLEGPHIAAICLTPECAGGCDHLGHCHPQEMGGMYEYIKSRFTGNGVMDEDGSWRELEYRHPPKSNQFGDRASKELSMLPKHLVLLPADKRKNPNFIKVPLRVGNGGNTFNRLFEADPEEELKGDNSVLEVMEVYEFRGMFNGPWLDRDARGGITHQLFQKDAPSAIALTRSHGSRHEAREVSNWGYTTATEFNSGNQKASPTTSGVWDQRYTTEMVRESLDKRMEEENSGSSHSREFNLVRTLGRTSWNQATGADH